MLQISLHRERTATFLSATRLVTLAFALLHLQASEQGHFRIDAHRITMHFRRDVAECDRLLRVLEQDGPETLIDAAHAARDRVLEVGEIIAGEILRRGYPIPK